MQKRLFYTAARQLVRLSSLVYATRLCLPCFRYYPPVRRKQKTNGIFLYLTTFLLAVFFVYLSLMLLPLIVCSLARSHIRSRALLVCVFVSILFLLFGTGVCDGVCHFGWSLVGSPARPRACSFLPVSGVCVGWSGGRRTRAGGTATVIAEPVAGRHQESAEVRLADRSRQPPFVPRDTRGEPA